MTNDYTLKTASLRAARANIGALDLEDKATVVGWGMPDYSAGISIARNTSFTAPKDGEVHCYLNVASGGYTITINDDITYTSTNTQLVYFDCYVPYKLSKGDVFKSTRDAVFHPYKGAN